MALDFGYIQRYNSERGFGFVSRTLQGSRHSVRRSARRSAQEVFFHIKTVKRLYPELAQVLDNGSYHNVSFWYETENGDKDEQVSKLWLNTKDIPDQQRDNLVAHIEELWRNINIPSPERLDQATLTLVGKARRDELYQERQKYERERREVKEQEQRRKEAERQAQETAIKEAARLTEEERRRIIESGSEVEIADWLKSANFQHQNHFWSDKRLISRVHYKGFLWNLAPSIVKKEITQKKFDKFFTKINLFLENINTYNYDYALQADASKLYPHLNEQDRQLAQEWLKKKKENEHELARVLSARAGEKFVARCYQLLRYKVQDIAVKQLSNESQDWKKYDLLLNGEIAIDVKNARRRVSARKNKDNQCKYSEFCIPEFKRNRGNEVIIAGVLSPYLQLKYFENPSEADFKIEPFLFLGEIKNSKIRKIEEIFCNKKLVSIKMPRGSSEDYLPPWLFDYPDCFYQKQFDAIKKFRTLNLQESEVPNWEDNQLFDGIFLTVFLTSKTKLPEQWSRCLNAWQRSFIEKFLEIKDERITLPHLFLTLLSHFIDMLSSSSEEYHPSKYLELLYQNKEQKHPLWIYDPLTVIFEFCQTLCTLWDNRFVMRLSEFKYFKFDGRGILKGKRSDDEGRETTVLAYCGGWKPGGKCGFTPLVLNKHQTCQICQWLKCPDCGHCGYK